MGLPELSELSFSLRFRGHWGIRIRVRGERLTISVPESEEDAIQVVLPDRSLTVGPGETSTLTIGVAGR
ncbi:glycosyl hydrolase family 65 protein [Streptomyces netropsis]|uniref:glycosyl hydrolase family 65 protein n=1 Tax=Streptomyces netropsis TaxID=55404 RepID=UPI0037BA2FE0